MQCNRHGCTGHCNCQSSGIRPKSERLHGSSDFKGAFLAAIVICVVVGARLLAARQEQVERSVILQSQLSALRRSRVPAPWVVDHTEGSRFWLAQIVGHNRGRWRSSDAGASGQCDADGRGSSPKISAGRHHAGSSLHRAPGTLGFGRTRLACVRRRPSISRRLQPGFFQARDADRAIQHIEQVTPSTKAEEPG